MRALIVFLKDTFYTAKPGSSGAAQWNYIGDDADQVREVVLGSGALVVFKLNPESGTAQAHLSGERADKIAFFPAGGWSGYAWEGIDEGAIRRAAAQASGITVPR